MKSNSYSSDKHEFLKGLPAIAGLSNTVYTKGLLPTGRVPTVAIIGTRRPTIYGSRVAFDFAEKLSRRGVVIVSGLAYGIDAAAHRGALSGGGVTIAVMAHGLDTVYPSGNRSLAQQIIHKGGALISPYQPGTPVHKFRFLERNQWVAGLADAVLVIEAEERSGTKATVRYALDLGKEVFAVPGPITSSQSSGPNRLIAEGAHPALTPEDILRIIAPDLGAVPPPSRGDTPAEQAVTRLIASGVSQTDALAVASGIEIGTLLSLLTILEIKGYVQRAPNGEWTLH